MTFEDGAVLSASCTVQVLVPVSNLSTSTQKLTVEIGQTVNVSKNIKFQPADATEKNLVWSSDNEKIATVSSDGKVTGVRGGACKITATTVDGSNKSVVTNVFVPSFAGGTQFRISSKAGGEVKLKYYGQWTDFSLQNSGYCAGVTYHHKENELTLKVNPKNAGTETVTLMNKGSNERYVVKIEIAHSAVYDNVSYPQLNYKDVARYPNAHKGENVRFTGKVLQVISSGSGVKEYRISSSGSYGNVVYVFDESKGAPLLEDDRVTVYGKLSGSITYTTVMGAQITIPSVTAENIKFG